MYSQVVDHVGEYAIDFAPKTSDVKAKWTKAVLGNNRVTLTLASWSIKKAVTTPQTIVTQICNGGKDNYEFGFNGQMKTNEIAGTGNHNTALFWEYDNRLGRRWNLDPKPKPDMSMYSTFSNDPIGKSDINGDQDGYESRLRRMEQRYFDGKITAEELRAFQVNSGRGGLLGAQIVASFFVGPEVLGESFLAESFLTRATARYVFSSTISAGIDVFAQAAINKFDFKKVDWFDVATNYIKIPGFGGKITKPLIEVAIKNVITSAVDYSQDEGWKYVGGKGNRNKNLTQAGIEALAGTVVDGVFGKLNKEIEERLEKAGVKGIEEIMTKIVGAQTEAVEGIIKNVVADKSKEKVKEHQEETSKKHE